MFTEMENNTTNSQSSFLSKIEDDVVIWTGEWKSDNYESYGSITIPLKRLSIGSGIVYATVTYEGCYKEGEEVILPINISYDTLESLRNKQVMYLEFNLNISSQEIRYCISEYNSNKISGIYLSYNPEDTGSIDLSPNGKEYIENGENKSNSWCVML